MATADIRRLYASGTTPTQPQLDAIVDDIETFINLTRLNDDNIQDESITASDKIIDGTLTNTKFMNDSVSTAKIVDNAASTEKFSDESVTAEKIADTNVTLVKIQDEAITTPKILDRNVTKPKMTSNVVVSSALSASIAAGSVLPSQGSAITNASVTITTEGNPVIIGFMSDGSNGDLSYDSNTVAETVSLGLSLFRDGTKICTQSYKCQPRNFSGIFGGVNVALITIPIGQFFYVDAPAAGTYTYTAQFRGNANFQDSGGGTTQRAGTYTVTGKMYAFEVT